MRKLLSHLLTLDLSNLRTIISKYYFLACIGLILLSSYIYVAFFRTRMPKDIPFNLTEIWFYILIYICLLYLYIIKKTLKPKNPPLIVIKLIQKISYPLQMLDYMFKNNKRVRPYYQNLLKKIIPVILAWWNADHVALIILCELLPRVILVSIFFVDVFIVGKIDIFYYFILLGLIPLGFKYFQYSLYYAREEYIKYLESLYDLVKIYDKYSEFKPLDQRHPKAIYHDKHKTVREYLAIQEQNSMETYPDDFEVEYYASPYARKEIHDAYLIKHNKTVHQLTMDDYNIIGKPFYDLIDTLIEFYSFLETYKFIPLYYKVIPYTKIFIYVMYFVCWTYILIKSYNNVTSWSITLKVLQILVNSLPMMEPFSDTFL